MLGGAQHFQTECSESKGAKMKNVSRWRPTKFVKRRGRLAASRNASEVNPSSRLMVDLVAACYQRHLSAHCRGRLVDLGCGKVPLFGAYRDLVSDVTCVDWQNSLHKGDHIDCLCDLSKPLPFESESFDTAIVSDVLEHLPEPTVMWSEMARILRPAGKCFVNVPFFYWLHEHPHDYCRYTEFALRRFAQSVGLKVVVFEAIGGSPEVFADMFAKHAARIPVLGGPTALLAQSMASAFVRLRIGRRVSEQSAAYYPFGYFMICQRADSPLCERSGD